MSAILALTTLSLGLAAAMTAPAAARDVATATVAELNQAIDAGRLTSVQLVERSLARIEAYDRTGPKLNSIISLNPAALAEAAALDAERKSKGRRSALHGIPVVVKDNIDTADLPTTAGSFVLAGSRPPDDAEVVKRLRAAGAIILAKTNLSEFANGPAMSSVAGRMQNPHNLARTPGGSSGGTGVAIAAGLVAVGFGTDTGGSVRVPASANGIVGLKPSFGLISADGVVPLAPSFDTVGPMGRSVADLAAVLDVVAAGDTNYGAALKSGVLNGARIGVGRDYMGRNAEIDAITENALAVLHRGGAELVDVALPGWYRALHIEWHGALMDEEFRTHIPGYLATLGPSYPKTLDDLVTRSLALTAPTSAGHVPNPARWTTYAKPGSRASLSGDPQFDAIRDIGLPLGRRIVAGVFKSHQLDAIIYPTMQKPFDLVDAPVNVLEGYRGPLFLSNSTGFPELVLPAGFDSLAMPVSISVLGRANDDARVLALGHALEQDLKVARLPALTPVLHGDDIGGD